MRDVTIDALLSGLEATPLAQEIRESIWLFPTLETIHILALSVVVGAIGMFDLRLLGWRGRARDAAELTRELLPWTWSFFALAAATGSLLFASHAMTYGHNPPFLLKLCGIGLAGANMAAFHATTYRAIAQWGRAAVPPLHARLAGGISLALWIAVVVAGRWIGFTT